MAATTAARTEGRGYEWIGRVIDDRYRVVEKIGEGGMGAVFVAEHLKLRKEVALKVIHRELLGDGELAARFAREAMASARLDHPHVASALDYGTLPDGGAYLVMQLVRGRSLQAVLETQGRIAWPLACQIAAQVADALAAAHAAGIVHRDLKPDNVLLEPRDDGSELVKVLDFGVARVSQDDQEGPEGAAPGRALTRVGTVIGTPGYMAPEQAMGEAVDSRADLYSLGVVLWEMLTGRPLFDTDELTTIVTQQLTETPPAVRAAAGDPGIPEGLEALVGRLLARRAIERPERASAVRDALRQLAYGGGAPATELTGPHSLASQTFPTIRQPAQEVSTWRTAWNKIRGLPTWMLALAGAVPVAVLLLGLVALSALSTGPASTTSTAPLRRILSIRAVPPEVRAHMDTLLHSDERRERREAAGWLRQHEPKSDVPDWAQAVVDLELGRGCRPKQEALGRIADIGNNDALPALERLAHAPKSGCGFLHLNDCYACLRGDLAQAISKLQH